MYSLRYFVFLLNVFCCSR